MSLLSIDSDPSLYILGNMCACSTLDKKTQNSLKNEIRAQ